MRRIKIPRYPFLFLKVFMAFIFLPIAVKICKPNLLLKLFNTNIKSTPNPDRINKTCLYSSFFISLWPWKKTKTPCLLRSLVLFVSLRSEGLKININFGVRHQEGLLKGHSWLTLEGKPYREALGNQGIFETIYTFP